MIHLVRIILVAGEHLVVLEIEIHLPLRASERKVDFDLEYDEVFSSDEDDANEVYVVDEHDCWTLAQWAELSPRQQQLEIAHESGPPSRKGGEGEPPGVEPEECSEESFLLPLGWERHQDAVSGAFYIWNPSTMESRWDRPPAAGTAIRAEGTDASSTPGILDQLPGPKRRPGPNSRSATAR